MPPEVIAENIDDVLSAEDVIDSHRVQTPLQDAVAVYDCAKR